MNAGPVVNPMSEYDVDAELLAQMREDFLPEAQDILDRLGTVLALLESAPSADAIQEIFRLVHTLKGTASFVGLESFRLLAHKLEDLFGAVRSGQLVVSAELMDLAFEAVHTLAALRQDLARGGSGESDVQPLAARLEEAASGRSAPSPAEVRPATGPAPEANASTDKSVAPAAGAARPRAVLAEESGDTLRVDVEVMDNLMVLVGELITNRNALLSIAERVGDGPLLETSSAIKRLTRQLQNTVTTARLTPVDRLFSRFIPVVRNLARDCGKKARLVVEGGDVPLDRAVSDEMHDPLVHLLRNAVDHGLELPEERRRLGKPVEGLVHLSAVRRGDDVTLRLSDDGAGIDLDAVRRRAVARGLLSEAEAAMLPDDQALRLIFRSGFSTTDHITDVSGRGVGLDVVTDRVRRMRGSVDVETEPGRGTTFVIRLPLTLVILNVLLVRTAGRTYSLPMHILRETMLVDLAEIHEMQQGPVAFVRGQALPVRRLSDWLHLPDASGPARRPAVIAHLSGATKSSRSMS